MCRTSARFETGVIMNRKFALAALACTALSSPAFAQDAAPADVAGGEDAIVVTAARSEEHTSELQSLMRISYAVFCLKKKTNRRSSHETSQYESTHTHNLSKTEAKSRQP